MDLSVKPDKSCGECPVCCSDLLIDAPGFTKPSSTLCKNYKHGVGCVIYESRPSVCSDFFCGWRRLTLGEEWRPDRSEIVILWEAADAATGTPNGFRFHFIGGLDKIFWRPFIAYLAELIEGKVPVYVSVPGPPGYKSRKYYLNTLPSFRQAVAARNFSAITGTLSGVIQACVDAPKDKDEFVNPRAD